MQDSDQFAYRHYDSYYPTSNKLLAKKLDERSRHLHLFKLKQVTPSIDNTSPIIYQHLQARSKKVKQDQGLSQVIPDKRETIGRDNKLLLNRIAHQMSYSPHKFDRKEKHHVVVKISETQRRNTALIKAQNERLQKRIVEKAPFYNRKVWAQDHKKALGYIEQISHYSNGSGKSIRPATAGQSSKPDMNNSNRPRPKTGHQRPRAPTAGRFSIDGDGGDDFNKKDAGMPKSFVSHSHTKAEAGSQALNKIEFKAARNGDIATRGSKHKLGSSRSIDLPLEKSKARESIVNVKSSHQEIVVDLKSTASTSILSPNSHEEIAVKANEPTPTSAQDKNNIMIESTVERNKVDSHTGPDVSDRQS